MKKWQPWTDYKSPKKEIKIKRPPCEFCESWDPQRVYYTHYDAKCGIHRREYVGFQCCVTVEQERDFSCFRPKE